MDGLVIEQERILVPVGLCQGTAVVDVEGELADWPTLSTAMAMRV